MKATADSPALTSIVTADSRAPVFQIVYWLRAAYGFARYLCRTILRHTVALIFGLLVAPVEIGFLAIFQKSFFTPARLAFVAPGLTFYTILATTLVSTPCHMVMMKETKLLRRFRASPLPTSALAVGMVCGSGMVSLTSSVATYLVAHAVSSVPFPEHLFATALVWVIALATMASYGMVVASLFSRVQNAIAAALPVLFLNIGLSGLLFQPGAMPRGVSYMSWVTPARPMCDWLRAVATSQPTPVSWEPALALVWLATLGWLAVRRFEWE